jgi:hypothetical protein
MEIAIIPLLLNILLLLHKESFECSASPAFAVFLYQKKKLLATRSLLTTTLLFDPDCYRETTSKQISIPFSTIDFSKNLLYLVLN